MKGLLVNNIGEDTTEVLRKVLLWNYTLGIGFRSKRDERTKVLTFFIERKYHEDGIKYLKRTGYGLQYTMYGVNNRISIHKRTQVLKQI
ncbi:hypothetical protein [Chryseobacterium sp. M5A1_1a]